LDNGTSVGDSVGQRKRQAEYYREYRKRAKTSTSAATDESRARKAAYMKTYRARKKAEQIDKLCEIVTGDEHIVTPTSTTYITSLQPRTDRSDHNDEVRSTKQEEQRARNAANNRAYRARKKEERLNKLRGIVTVDEYISTPTSTSTLQPPRTCNVASTSTEESELDAACRRLCDSDDEQVTSTKSNTAVEWLRYSRDTAYIQLWGNAKARFSQTFRNIKFNQSCSVCDRLWTDASLHDAPRESHDILRREFPGEDVTIFKVCR
jgi:hypothetical protein